ncbi:hypothetical protein, partial [Psychrobacter alimentarius]|uniref:hypothetical protein n=1 Tax=Psychrobacter alimentarius TaxID=261164 RepID=UPI003FD43E07
EYFNSAASIVDIANKAVQPVDFASSSVVDQSVIAMNAQLRAPEAIAVQDTFLEMTKGMSAYNNSLMSVKERMIQSIGGTSVYEDMMASANLVRKSIEPYRSAFDAVRTSFEASESFKVARELQSQAFLANSLLSEYSSVFKQFESLRNLESFKAISRLENFPSDKAGTQSYDKTREITEDSLAEAKSIDASISDEVSSVDDFNELSEDRQSILLSLYSDYYYPIILTYLVIGIWWNIFLNDSLDLSNRVFVYFENTKGVFSYLGTNFYRPVSGVVDGLVATFIYMKFPEFKKNSKDVGVKKAIKMLFYSSDSIISRSMLKGCRVITEDNTHLRESHHVDAIGIEILSKGTIVRVVEKEGKSWLLVELLFNTEIGKGWILRSSTTTFK